MTVKDWRVKTRKPPTQREHEEQKALFTWAALAAGKRPELALMFAIPNGGQRHPAVAKKLKAEGVKAGVPDICLPVARGDYNGLYVELKTVNGRATDTQKQWMADLAKQGYAVQLCYGWVMA